MSLGSRRPPVGHAVPIVSKAGGDRTLLIADSSPGMLLMLRSAAERRGFRVIEARNGVEAVRLGIEHRPDAVVVDLDLAGLSGIEVARALGKVSAISDMPPVLLRVGRALGSQTLREAIDAGAADCIEKTCPIGELFDRIEQHIRPSADRPSAPFQWASTAIDELRTMRIRVVHDRNGTGTAATGSDLVALGLLVTAL